MNTTVLFPLAGCVRTQGSQTVMRWRFESFSRTRDDTLGYSAVGKFSEMTMQQPAFELAVVMQKRAIDNRWQSEVWEPVAVLDDARCEVGAGRMAADNEFERWVFRGLRLQLRREEAEGYYLNISTQKPRVFVMWQIENDCAVPQQVSASYNDACTWLDAGEQVDSVAMPPELYSHVSAFARDHYRPQPKKRIRPRSFQSKDQPPRSRR